MGARGFRFKGLAALAIVATGTVLAARLFMPPSFHGPKVLAASYAISRGTLFDYVKELTSPKYEGRLTGTPGFAAAARWCERLFEEWKLEPAGDDGTWEQHFPHPYTLVLPGGRLALQVPVSPSEVSDKTYRYEDDYYPGSTSDSGTVTAEVVYVGYGITAPELGYDDYAAVDVKGKIVLVEPSVPTRSVSTEKPEIFKKWRPYSFNAYKVRNAAAHGAVGLLYNNLIANPNSEFVKGFQLAYVGTTVIRDLFAGSGKKHDALVKSMVAHHRPRSFELNKTITLTNVTEHHPEGVGYNVIGVLEGTDPDLRKQSIIIGAHLDHVGLNDRLMPGANDNASGDAVLLAVARALATPGVPLKRTIVFILFGGEEEGCKGSQWYVDHPVVPNEDVQVMINLESVGSGGSIRGRAGENYPEIWAYFDRNNAAYIHRQLESTRDPNLIQPFRDSAIFMSADIPAISFGANDGNVPVATYHTTRDTIEWIDASFMEDMARLLYLSVVEMANR